MMKEKLQKRYVVAILAILCCSLWGSAFPCIKVGYVLFGVDSADTASQILFAGVRFFLAGILTLIIGSIGTRKVLKPKSAKSFQYIIKLAMVQTVLQYVFFYSALARAGGVSSSIINGSNVFLAVLISALVFKTEKLTAKKVCGCLLGFAGVIVVSLGGGEIAFSWTGEGFVLIAALAYAISTAMIKIYSEYENPVLLSGAQFAVGGLIMTIAGLCFGGRIAPSGVGACVLLFYMACISAVSYSIWGLLMKYNDVSSVSVYGCANPIMGTILSAVILNESDVVGLQIILALCLVSCGIFVVNKKERQK
ncbi:MAG: DMT family transporter [Clostridia bacterium]|nr:DMT family transporter [Clostridia bacterium]